MKRRVKCSRCRIALVDEDWDIKLKCSEPLCKGCREKIKRAYENR